MRLKHQPWMGDLVGFRTDPLVVRLCCSGQQSLRRASSAGPLLHYNGHLNGHLNEHFTGSSPRDYNQVTPASHHLITS
ncbi:unnamed protein product [Boreogadus saida]